MQNHPALTAGRAAVITGAAKGIGFAAARRFASLGMKLCIADSDEGALRKAGADLGALLPGGDADIRLVHADVSRFEDVQRLKDTAYSAFGEVALLMNNAGIGGRPMKPWDSYESFRQVIDVNFWGIAHGVQAFTEAMIAQGTPAAIVNLGSKQGITTPPGNVAYSVSKAGVKVLTEQLAYELRRIEGCKVSAHLLVPGWTFTSMTSLGATSEADKPEGAWTADQVIDIMQESIARGDFYILCPDGQVTREVDERRIQWAADDLIKNRPALSRWHPDYKDEAGRFMEGTGTARR